MNARFQSVSVNFLLLVSKISNENQEENKRDKLQGTKEAKFEGLCGLLLIRTLSDRLQHMGGWGRFSQATAEYCRNPFVPRGLLRSSPL